MSDQQTEQTLAALRNQMMAVSAKCGWEYMNGKRCGNPAAAIWTVITSAYVCKHHAKEVGRMRMGKLSMLPDSVNNKKDDQ